MTTYSKSEKYDIKYSEAQEQYYIFKKNEDTPQVGSWTFAADAIDFAEKLTEKKQND